MTKATTKGKKAPQNERNDGSPAQGTGIEAVAIGRLKANPGNPRVVRDEKFLKLVASIEQFPDMLNKRPLVAVTDADGKLMVIGGNQRLRACQHLGLKSVPVIFADTWTEEQRREFVVKDNASAGEWDWEALANEWDADKLSEWGVPVFKDISDQNLDDFFKDNPNKDKDKGANLVLKYTEADYAVVMERLAAIGGTKEQAIFNLLTK